MLIMMFAEDVTKAKFNNSFWRLYNFSKRHINDINGEGTIICKSKWDPMILNLNLDNTPT